MTAAAVGPQPPAAATDRETSPDPPRGSRPRHGPVISIHAGWAMETCALKVTSAFLFGLTVPSITPAARPVKGCLSAGGVLYCPGTKQKGVYRHVPALSHRGKCQAGVKPLCHPLPRCFPAAISVRRGGPDRGGTVCRPGGHRRRVHRQPGHAGGDQFYYRPVPPAVRCWWGSTWAPGGGRT